MTSTLPAPAPTAALLPPGTDDPAAVAERLDALRAAMLRAEADVVARHPDVTPGHRVAAVNLAHYLAARREDLRPLQERLARLGLSSLGRMEGHVLFTVDAVRRALAALLGRPGAVPSATDLDPSRALARTEAAATALFGPRRRARRTRVMVTLPSEAADSPGLVRSLVDEGMAVARINCAHDDADAWTRMAAHVRAVGGANPPRVLMDLAGPKLRTGALAPGPRVLHASPRRDARGEVIAPVRVALAAPGAPTGPEPVDLAVPVDGGWASTLAVGDDLDFTDTRGRSRGLRVVRAGPEGAVALAHATLWIEEGTEVRRLGPSGRVVSASRVGPVPAVDRPLLLRPADRLVLTRDAAPGGPAPVGADGRVLGPATIPCSMPEVFACVRAGEAIWFDDGRIGGRVVAVGPESVEVEIVTARPDGSRLGSDKGINLPDTRFCVDGLTPADVEDLRVAAGHADVVGLSFVDDPGDVRALWRALRTETDRSLGVLVKIETRRAVARLPDILLAGLEGFPFGVMIARGDLAVECGFERLAEVQEEILWMAEAAHAPVVWATQVLETAAKKGRPTRAEITDAGMAVRAECVMLNKGPHLRTALRVLDGVLSRMEEHHWKKSSLLRPLSISRREGAPDPA
jgi:pyruvate kinase